MGVHNFYEGEPEIYNYEVGDCDIVCVRSIGSMGRFIDRVMHSICSDVDFTDIVRSETYNVFTTLFVAGAATNKDILETMNIKSYGYAASVVGRSNSYLHTQFRLGIHTKLIIDSSKKFMKTVELPTNGQVRR